jgi:hypothetical protein
MRSIAIKAAMGGNIQDDIQMKWSRYFQGIQAGAGAAVELQRALSNHGATIRLFLQYPEDIEKEARIPSR